jgi:hypothetical protein
MGRIGFTPTVSRHFNGLEIFAGFLSIRVGNFQGVVRSGWKRFEVCVEIQNGELREWCLSAGRAALLWGFYGF